MGTLAEWLLSVPAGALVRPRIKRATLCWKMPPDYVFVFLSARRTWTIKAAKLLIWILYACVGHLNSHRTTFSRDGSPSPCDCIGIIARVRGVFAVYYLVA